MVQQIYCANRTGRYARPVCLAWEQPVKTNLRTICIVDDGGIAIGEDGKIPDRVRWTEIVEIRAYKLDLFTFDALCFLLATPSTTLEICEEDVGFRQAMAALQARYRFPEGWYGNLIAPAFERNEMILWRSSR